MAEGQGQIALGMMLTLTQNRTGRAFQVREHLAMARSMAHVQEMGQGDGAMERDQCEMAVVRQMEARKFKDTGIVKDSLFPYGKWGIIKGHSIKRIHNHISIFKMSFQMHYR